MRANAIVIAAAIVLIGASHVDAQTARRPTRPYRGLFGGGQPPDPARMRHELTLTTDVLAGYGDVLDARGPGVGEATRDTESGSTGFIDAAMHYMYGRTARSIAIDGNVYTNTYLALDIDSTVGGSVTLRGDTTVGRRNSLTVSQDFAYEPTLFLGMYSPLQPTFDPTSQPESGQSSGFVAQASTSLASRAAIDHRWTVAQSTSASVAYTRRNYLDDLGFDSNGYSAVMTHSWGVSRNVRLNGTYGYSHDSFAGLGPDGSPQSSMPLSSHNFEFAVSQSRRLSRTRQVRLSGGAGASRVHTLSTIDGSAIDYWMPTGHGTVGVDIGRSWSLAVDYRRAVSVLQGITLESYATDAAQVRVDGLFGWRVETSMSLAYANGQSGSGVDNSSYYSLTGAAQLRYALARCCAMSVNYDNYYYQLNDVSQLPTSVPSQFDRNAFRVGFTWWLPLVGTYADRPAPREPGRRNR